MTLQQIYYALTIAETKSMNKAAERLFVSQPSLSNAIKELEKDTGITIFFRTGKGVSVTNEGENFLIYARQLYQQYELLQEFVSGEQMKYEFAVSTQHYSFAVSAFVETVKEFDTAEYEFAIRETRTMEVIEDVGSLKSEIGVLYLSDFNRKIITKFIRENGLKFHFLRECEAYVYLWKGHPLAGRASISFEDLADYPCLAFEQGEKGSLYFSEEILSEHFYPRMIRANDRATMKNLMVGLNGYTLCSGVIYEDLNGDSFTVVPFREDEEHQNCRMELGYITKNTSKLSRVGEVYIRKLKETLGVPVEDAGEDPGT